MVEEHTDKGRRYSNGEKHDLEAMYKNLCLHQSLKNEKRWFKEFTRIIDTDRRKKLEILG